MLEYTIVVASTNAGKLKEINSILTTLEGLKLQLKSLKDYSIAEPDEPYESFLENAIHKAKYYAKQTNLPTLSEDAGLCIEALDGFPGVRTKEFVVACGGIENAFAKLQQMLSSKHNMNAYFNCSAALYIPQLDQLITYEAQDIGRIIFPPQGTTGFGFDPIFIPTGYEQTMAELGEPIKNQISHRALAIKGLAEKLSFFLKNNSSQLNFST
jgi:XTP/dITP diphosphohydrolase